MIQSDRHERSENHSPRRLVIPRVGSPNVLRVDPLDPETPGPAQVRVRVHYAGINFADLMMRLGLYRPKPKMPFTPGYELSGVVDSLGSGVTDIAEGQPVVAVVPSGAQQTHLCVERNQVIPLPDDIPLEQAAAIPVTYLTAWHMLVHLGALRKGETVLIHGIAGGVGTAAVQIAKLFEAGTIFGTASSSKAEQIHLMRAKMLPKTEFGADLLRQTDGRGADHILDPIGGSHLRESYDVLAPGGRLYSFGLSSAAPSSFFNPFAALKALWHMRGFSMSQMMIDNKAVLGIHMGTFQDQELLRGHLAKILAAVGEGKLKPVVDSVFHLDDAQKAHEHIHARKNFGKVLLDLR
jgi:synaptic vesicle membrane protein VAT-1